MKWLWLLALLFMGCTSIFRPYPFMLKGEPPIHSIYHFCYEYHFDKNDKYLGYTEYYCQSEELYNEGKTKIFQNLHEGPGQ
jgi:hypothetical protein